MQCKVMHEVCESFYCTMKKWWKLSREKDFLAHLEIYFVYALLLPTSYATKVIFLFK